MSTDERADDGSGVPAGSDDEGCRGTLGQVAERAAEQFDEGIVDLLARSSGDTVDLGEVVDREASRLGVSGIRSVYDAESGADRQRRLRAEAGVDALREALLVAPALP